MPTLTISLADERWQPLLERARQLGLSPEELVCTAVEEMLARPAAQQFAPAGAAPDAAPRWLTVDAEFKRVADHVLHKNDELYGRLA